MHLGAMMLLYRQPLLAAVEAQLNGTTDAQRLGPISNEVQRCRTDCAVTAQLICRVLRQSDCTAKDGWLTT
jgi:hypothetical protein